MSLTSVEREAIAAILKPIKTGRKKLINRKQSSLGDSEFIDGLLAEAKLLDAASFEADGTITILKVDTARWLLNPLTIAPPTI